MQMNALIDPNEFVNILHKVVKMQESDIKLSLIGKGLWRLKPEYKRLAVKEDVY